jgi:hypothetical protein
VWWYRVRFRYPSFAPVCHAGDTSNHAIRAVTVSTKGVSTLAGRKGVNTPFTDGVGTLATFNSPQGIALDSSKTFVLVVSVTRFGTMSHSLTNIYSITLLCRLTLIITSFATSYCRRKLSVRLLVGCQLTRPFLMVSVHLQRSGFLLVWHFHL